MSVDGAGGPTYTRDGPRRHGHTLCLKIDWAGGPARTSVDTAGEDVPKGTVRMDQGTRMGTHEIPPIETYPIG